MKDFGGTVKKIFSAWFWSWFAISICIVIAMLIVKKQPYLNQLSGAIIALMILMPIRDWSYRFITWAIEYVASIDSSFRKRVFPWTTMNILTSEKKRIYSLGFYRSLKAGIWFLDVMYALIFMINQDMSFTIVYSFLHTLENIFISHNITFLMMFMYLLINLLFFIIMGWYTFLVLDEKLFEKIPESNEQSIFTYRIRKGKLPIVILFFAVFYLKILVSGNLLLLDGKSIIAFVFFYTCMVIIPLTLIMLYWKLLSPYIRKRNKTIVDSQNQEEPPSTGGENENGEESPNI